MIQRNHKHTNLCADLIVGWVTEFCCHWRFHTAAFINLTNGRPNFCEGPAVNRFFSDNHWSKIWVLCHRESQLVCDRLHSPPKSSSDTARGLHGLSCLLHQMSSLLVFNRVYRLEYNQSCWYFRPLLWTIASLIFSLVQPPPPPLPVWISAVYVCLYSV